jgi:aspartyl-tRNA(Asn)/glutamyl-tRNA(Gln) amidotransferase subunit B
LSVYDKYEIVVGLEVHAQLATDSKIFCADATEFGAEPNTQVSPISLGHPGTLPLLNEKVLEYAIKMGLACNSRIQEVNQFSRKNYFYADLPKGYQITQMDTPICIGGYVEIEVDGQIKKVQLSHIHMEEDAGKSTHDIDPHYSLIDLNRAGVPLIEIVSNPVIHSSEEAYLYLVEVRKLVRYLGICDGNMEEGSLRCDANISVRLHGETELGQRTEVKNMNSMRNVKRAIDSEVKRQIDIIEAGGTIDQETRSFNADDGSSFTLRSKEDANDYRYFPDPDLPPAVITEAYLDSIRNEMPALPKELIHKYTTDFGLSIYDAKVLTEEKETAQYFNQVIGFITNYKSAANWIIGPVKSYLNENSQEIMAFPLPHYRLAELIKAVDDGLVSHSMASQRIFPALVAQPEKTVLQLAEEMNLLQQSDGSAIEAVIEQVLADNEADVVRYKAGNKALTGFFMGLVMKASGGKVDPKIANRILAEKLNR